MHCTETFTLKGKIVGKKKPGVNLDLSPKNLDTFFHVVSLTKPKPQSFLKHLLCQGVLSDFKGAYAL